MQSREGRYS
nr:unnamed protein product [Callosobruchus chinensis]